LWSFYRVTGEKLPSAIQKADQVFPHFLVTHIPPGLAGLFIASLLGSAMAMLASDMNCLATIAVEDFYGLARPRSTDRQRLRVGKAIVLLSGIAAGAVAIRLSHTQGTALSLYFTITAIVAGGLAGLFLLAFLFPQATRRGALAGIIANLLFTIWATLSLNGTILNLGRFNFPWHNYMIGAVGHIVLLSTGLLFSLFLPDASPSAPQLTLRGWLATRNNDSLKSNLTPQKSNA